MNNNQRDEEILQMILQNQKKCRRCFIVGPTGPTGPTGIAGATGPTGPSEETTM